MAFYATGQNGTVYVWKENYAGSGQGQWFPIEDQTVFSSVGAQAPPVGQVWDSMTGATTSLQSWKAPTAATTGTGTTPPATGGAPTQPTSSPTPTPTMGTGGSYGTQDIEAQSPWVAYMRQLGLANRDYLTPAESYKASLVDPWTASYDVANRMAATQGTGKFPIGSFTNFAVSNPFNVYQTAAGNLQSLFGLTPDQRSLANLTYENGPDSGAGSLSELQDLLKAGLLGTYGGATSSWLAKQLPKQQNQWNAQQIATGSGGTFLDYLKSKYNLAV